MQDILTRVRAALDSVDLGCPAVASINGSDGVIVTVSPAPRGDDTDVALVQDADGFYRVRTFRYVDGDAVEFADSLAAYDDADVAVAALVATVRLVLVPLL